MREAGASLVGIDSLNIDDTADLTRPVHTMLLRAGIPIVEHLCGLSALPDAGASESGPHLGASRDGTTVLMACRMWIVSPEDPAWMDDAAGVVRADCLKARAPAGGGWETPASYDFKRGPNEWAIPCGPPLALGGGEWIFPMERHALATVPDWLRRYNAFAVSSVKSASKLTLRLFRNGSTSCSNISSNRTAYS